MYELTFSPLYHVDDVVALATSLKLKFKQPQIVAGLKPGTVGKVFFAFLPGSNRETGEAWILFALQNARAPRHKHRPSGAPGLPAESVEIISGDMKDVTDDGRPVVVHAGQTITHGDNTVHAPEAEWFAAGIYHQPRGSEMIP